MKALVTIFVLSASLFFWASCGQVPGSQNIEKSAAEASVEVIELTDEFYRAAEQSIFQFRHKADYLNVLTGNTAFPRKTFGVQSNNVLNRIKENQKLIAVYSNLYNAYYKMLALNMDKTTSGMQIAAQACVDQLKKTDTTPAEKENTAKLEESTAAYQMSTNELMYGLNERFTETLTADLGDIRTFIDQFYQKYSDGLNKVPTYKFDTLKVEQLVDEPYRDKQVLIKLYKLQLAEEARAQVGILSNRAKLISDLLKELNMMHAEFIKRNRSDKDIKERLMKIEELSGQN
jgi:hypothetical protein